MVRGGATAGRRRRPPPRRAAYRHLDGDMYDPRCTWLRHRQIPSDGAILVRPDRFVAWRHPTASKDPFAALARALSQILARPVDRSVAGVV
jgi:2,4-dichlorophenol 6-monooxygenase